MEKKIVFIILDGLFDDEIEELGRKTPLESSAAYNIHKIAKKSKFFMVKTEHRFLPVGSVTAMLGLLGYNPYLYYPHGRASFEAIAQGIKINNGDVIFRCNTVQLNKPKTKIKDFQAGMIETSTSKKIIDCCKKILPPSMELAEGKSYRHTLIARNSPLEAQDILCFEPHTHLNQEIKKILINNANLQIDKKKKQIITELNRFMLKTIPILEEYNFKEKTMADMLWLWSPSDNPNLPAFKRVFPFRNPVIISGSDFLIGISQVAKIPTDSRPDFTGDSDTNFEGKRDLLLKSLKNGNDFIFLHINASDEESHRKNYLNKKNIIEKIDKIVIAKLWKFIENSPDNYILVLGGDHYTSSLTGNHKTIDVPLMIYNNKKNWKSGTEIFSEKAATKLSTKKILSWDLINELIKS